MYFSQTISCGTMVWTRRGGGACVHVRASQPCREASKHFHDSSKPARNCYLHYFNTKLPPKQHSPTTLPTAHHRRTSPSHVTVKSTKLDPFAAPQFSATSSRPTPPNIPHLTLPPWAPWSSRTSAQAGTSTKPSSAKKTDSS